jgi:hypothetical protein
MWLQAAVLTGLAFFGRSTPPPISPILDDAQSGECLVQRGVSTVKLGQPRSADPYAIQGTAEFFNGTAANETARNYTIVSESFYKLSHNLWSYVAYSLCSHWKMLIFIFILLWCPLRF